MEHRTWGATPRLNPLLNSPLLIGNQQLDAQLERGKGSVRHRESPSGLSMQRVEIVARGETVAGGWATGL